MKKTNKKLVIFLIAFIVIAFSVVGFWIFNFDWKYELPKNIKINTITRKEVEIVDLNSDTRPIAVMINNHPSAVPNHAGLQDAYLVYEIIVEGGLTRLMAVYKDKTTARIGSVRSSRHYFLDYALENDAIYVHYGYSDRAKNDISSLGVNNINGLYDSGFIRDTTLNVAWEHTAFTSIEGIMNVVAFRNYRTTTSEKTLLNYTAYPTRLSDIENSQIAYTINIPYSYIQKTSYVYDTENKVYKRYVNGKEHIDAVTNEIYTAKNIITYQVYNYSFDSYGRQDLNNIGSGTGYYISEGYAIPIKWEKTSRSSQTKYYYENGEELKVNDGNTYIQIQPKGQELEILAGV